MKIDGIEYEIENHALQTKILYLNGYLDALALVSSYDIVGMSYNIFAYNYSAGDILESLSHNSYELYGVYPNEYNFELVPIEDWTSLVLNGMQTQGLNAQYLFALENFISMFKSHILNKSTNCFKIQIDTNGKFDRLVGFDLVFEIAETKLIVLQIYGSD